MNETSRNIKLGLFVITGMVILIIALYLIGKKQNLFGNTFLIRARFYNVNGLMEGNNVRFGGINIGTVDNIEIVSDTLVMVDMIIKSGTKKYIKKNAVATLGSDGLMGDKLINITAGQGPSEPVNEGDELQAYKPLEMDQMLKTLNVSNENIKAISSNLKNITDKISGHNTFWSLLLDTTVAENLKSAVVNIKLMSDRTVMVAGDLKNFTTDIKNGKGSLGALITDTTISSGLKQTVVKFQKVSDTTAIIVSDARAIVKDLKAGKGTLGVLLTDTALVHNLNESAGNFNENMKAARSSWPFKKYYKKQKSKK